MNGRVNVPDGFRVLSPSHDDAPRIAELMSDAERADGVDEETTANDVLEQWRRLDLNRDAWIIERTSGATAGYADATVIAYGRYRADGYVAPQHCGNGVGAALIELTEARALELAGNGPARLYNALVASNEAGRTLLEGAGYEHARRFLRMAIDLDAPPGPVELPDGITGRSFEPERDGPAVHAAIEECFADHWDPVFVPYEQWRAAHLAGDGFDPALWILAAAGAEIAGVAACRTRYGRGFVEELGVRRAWRGLGLGLALLRLALAEFWRRGERTVALSVDSDNLTGATRLYERAGMHVEFEMGIYRKVLA